LVLEQNGGKFAFMTESKTWRLKAI
jgi:hypothetical protein